MAIIWVRGSNCAAAAHIKLLSLRVLANLDCCIHILRVWPKQRWPLCGRSQSIPAGKRLDEMFGQNSALLDVCRNLLEPSCLIILKWVFPIQELYIRSFCFAASVGRYALRFSWSSQEHNVMPPYPPGKLPVLLFLLIFYWQFLNQAHKSQTINCIFFSFVETLSVSIIHSILNLKHHISQSHKIL